MATPSHIGDANGVTGIVVVAIKLILARVKVVEVRLHGHPALA